MTTRAGLAEKPLPRATHGYDPRDRSMGALFVAAGLRTLPSLNRVLVAVSAIRGSQPALDRIADDLSALETGPEAPDDARTAPPLDPAPLEF
ncbi:MAG: hypothetical protein ABR585_15965, partial [Gemmatimonadaceae bacterium]